MKFNKYIIISFFLIILYFILESSLFVIRYYDIKLIIPSFFLFLINAYAFLSNKKSIKIYVLSINVILVAIITYYFRNNVFLILNDTWAHLVYIKSTIVNGILTTFPYYVESYLVPPHYSFWHIILAFISSLTKIQPHIFWSNLSPILIILGFFFFFLFVKELTKNYKISFLATILCLFLGSLLESLAVLWQYRVYPNQFALFTLFPLTLYLFFYDLRKNKLFLKILTGILLGITFITHIQVGSMLFITILSYLIFDFLIKKYYFKQKLKFHFPKLIFLIPAFLISLPWLVSILKLFLFSTEHANAYRPYLQKLTLKIFNITIANPIGIYNQQMPTVWLFCLIGFTVCIYKIIKKQANQAHVFLATTTLTTLIILFTPLFTLLNIFAPLWVLIRFFNMIQIYILIPIGVLFVIELFKSIKLYKSNKLKNLLLIILTLFLFSMITPKLLNYYEGYHDPNKYLPTLTIWQKDFSYLDLISQNKVILSDEFTSYILPYFTNNYVVAMPSLHGSPFINHQKRLEAVNGILGKTEINYSILDNYNVNYIFLNLRTNIIQSSYAENITQKFDNPNFKLRYYNEGVWIYEYI